MDKLRSDYLKASLNAAVAENPRELSSAFSKVSGDSRNEEYKQKLSQYIKLRV